MGRFTLAQRGLDGRVFPVRSSGGGSGRYTFNPLVWTQAEADANNFVNEFSGGASANETGVGGGLSGADLVLTQNGGIAAASGGWRPLTNTQDFTMTSTALNTFLQNSGGFSLGWHFRNADFSTNDELRICFLDASVGTARMHMVDSSQSSQHQFSMFCYTYSVADGYRGIYSIYNPATTEKVFPEADEFCCVISLDNTTDVMFMGVSIGSEPPTSIGDFYNFVLHPSGGIFDNTTVDFTGSSAEIVGSKIDCDVKAFTMSKTPFVSVAA